MTTCLHVRVLVSVSSVYVSVLSRGYCCSLPRCSHRAIHVVPQHRSAVLRRPSFSLVFCTFCTDPAVTAAVHRISARPICILHRHTVSRPSQLPESSLSSFSTFFSLRWLPSVLASTIVCVRLPAFFPRHHPSHPLSPHLYIHTTLVSAQWLLHDQHGLRVLKGSCKAAVRLRGLSRWRRWRSSSPGCAPSYSEAGMVLMALFTLSPTHATARYEKANARATHTQRERERWKRGR